MPKIKTHRGAHKRFKFTSKGKVKRKKAYAGHLLSHKKQARIRKLRKRGDVDKVNKKSIRRLLPYS